MIIPSQRHLHNAQHTRQTNIPSVGFEPTNPAVEWQQTYTLDHTDQSLSYITLPYLFTSHGSQFKFTIPLPS